jgi:excinuclease ABC subunit B
MKAAIDETNRRRAIQEAYNIEHNIEPRGITKSIRDLTDRVKVLAESKARYSTGAEEEMATSAALDPEALSTEDLARLIKQIEKEMKDAARALEFEKAAALRDQLVQLRGIEVQRKVGV